MKVNLTVLRAFWQRYWLPLLSIVVLWIACRDSDYDDGLNLARLFSGAYYKTYIAVVVAILVGLALHRRKMQTIIWGLELSAYCLVITNFLKYSFHLPRPEHMKHGLIVHGGYSPGFPSAHTAFAFGLAWLMFVLKPRYAPLWFAFAVTVGWSRVETRAHYPYQVMCGAVLGMLIAYLISRATRKTSGRWKCWSTRPQKISLIETQSNDASVEQKMLVKNNSVLVPTE